MLTPPFGELRRFLLVLVLSLVLSHRLGAQTELITNGNFETGTTAGWTVTNSGIGDFYISTPGAPTPDIAHLPTAPNPNGGLFYAVTDQTSPGTHALIQKFTVPLNVAAVTLAFDIFFNNNSSTFTPNGPLNHTGVVNQLGRVDLLTSGAGAFDTGGGVITNFLIGGTPGGNPHAYTHYVFDLTGVVAAGLSYQLRFGESDNSGIFNLGVDNVSILASAQAAGTGVTESQQPTILLIDAASIASALLSSVPTALAQRELALGGSRTALRDFNGRLFRARAAAGQNADVTESGEDEGTEYHTVTVGEGDGEEPARGGHGKKVVCGVAPPVASRWEVFTSFDYGNLDMDADGEFLGLQSDTYAGSIGAERSLTQHLLLGAGISYLYSDSDVGTDVDGITLATYLSGTWGRLYADLLYGATLLDHDIDRPTGLGDTSHAKPNSVTHAINFNTGYNFFLDSWVTGPFIGIDYAHSEIEGYVEHGGGTANTGVSEQSTDSLLTRLGWQASYRKKTSRGAITPQVRLSWERENLDSDDDLTVGLLQSPYYVVTGNTLRSAGGGFHVTVPGQSREKDYLVAGAGVLVEMSRHTSVILDYDGYFLANGYAAHFAKLTFSWKF